MPAENYATDISVIGLGPMGVALAEALVKGGKQVTVWNRSPEKADELVRAGAKRAADAAEAVAASPVTIVVVASIAVAGELLAQAGNRVAGRVIVNLTAAPPKDAVALGERITAAGARYLTGTIMSYPKDIGLADTAIIYSGSEDAFEAHRETLRLLAGQAVHVGPGWDRAKQVSWPLMIQSFAAFGAFMEGANVARRAGISNAEYAEWIVATLFPFYARLIRDAARRMDEGDFAGDQATIETEAHAVDGMVAVLKADGLPSAALEAIQGYLKQAKAAGLGDASMAAIGGMMGNRGA